MKFLLLMSLYLLGSARSESSTLALGASGLPVEPLAFMDHMTSAQRLSSQYFSPASPSGSRTSYETSPGKTTSGDEHALVGRALGEHSTGERASGQPAAVSEHAVVEHTSGEQPAVEHTSGEQSSGEQPLGEQASGEQVSDEQPSGEQVSGEKQLDEQPPAMLSTTVSGSVLNCYTCSYMNDQGQCLHGEGVCSTQSSQQCMLKKIFEGGKLQFMVQGCENKCPSMSLFSHGTRMHIICCQNESFCNKV